MFARVYPDLNIQTYAPEENEERWRERLNGIEVVILHEWNPPALARLLLNLRDEIGFKLLFHDTHHRASSSPEQMQQFGLDRFDGVLAFGEALRKIYRERFGIDRVWVLHEAADTTVFHPRAHVEKETDVVWIGNWGEGERSAEIQEFFLKPAAALASAARFSDLWCALSGRGSSGPSRSACELRRLSAESRCALDLCLIQTDRSHPAPAVQLSDGWHSYHPRLRGPRLRDSAYLRAVAGHRASFSPRRLPLRA